jgi:secretion system chaperone SscA
MSALGSQKEQDGLYASGYSSYTSGNFGQASKLFSSLVLANPYDERYWRGLASSKQMEGQYEEAARAWAMVSLLVDKDPMPHFHAAECLTSLHDSEQALKALNMSESLLNADSQELRSKIQLLKKLNQEG